jgi:hypothetical protein
MPMKPLGLPAFCRATIDWLGAPEPPMTAMVKQNSRSLEFELFSCQLGKGGRFEEEERKVTMPG